MCTKCLLTLIAREREREIIEKKSSYEIGAFSWLPTHSVRSKHMFFELLQEEEKNKRFILTHSELTGSGGHPKEEKQTDPDIGFKRMLNLDVQAGFGSDAILKYGSGSVFDTL